MAAENEEEDEGAQFKRRSLQKGQPLSQGFVNLRLSFVSLASHSLQQRLSAATAGQHSCTQPAR